LSFVLITFFSILIMVRLLALAAGVVAVQAAPLTTPEFVLWFGNK